MFFQGSHKLPSFLLLGGELAGIAGYAMGAQLMHFHICSAIACYLCFVACVVLNIGIVWNKRWPVSMAIALCEAGLLAAFVTLVTGAIWARQAWGAAWVWEPRLTGMFLMTLVFLSWRLAVAILGPQGIMQPQITSSLAVLGLPAMAFTHVATRLMGGIHPHEIPQTAVLESHSLIFFGTSAFCIVALCLGITWIRHQKLASRMEPKAK